MTFLKIHSCCMLILLSLHFPYISIFCHFQSMHEKFPSLNTSRKQGCCCSSNKHLQNLRGRNSQHCISHLCHMSDMGDGVSGLCVSNSSTLDMHSSSWLELVTAPLQKEQAGVILPRPERERDYVLSLQVSNYTYITVEIICSNSVFSSNFFQVLHTLYIKGISWSDKLGMLG